MDRETLSHLPSLLSVDNTYSRVSQPSTLSPHGHSRSDLGKLKSQSVGY